MKRFLYVLLTAATMVMLISATALADRGPVCCIQPNGWVEAGN